MGMHDEPVVDDEGVEWLEWGTEDDPFPISRGNNGYDAEAGSRLYAFVVHGAEQSHAGVALARDASDVERYFLNWRCYRVVTAFIGVAGEGGYAL